MAGNGASVGSRWYQGEQRSPLGEVESIGWVDLSIVGALMAHAERGGPWRIAVDTFHGQRWWLLERFGSQDQAMAFVTTVLLPAIEAASDGR